MGDLTTLPNFANATQYQASDFNAAFANLTIANAAVTTNKLADNNVTVAKLAVSAYVRTFLGGAAAADLLHSLGVGDATKLHATTQGITLADAAASIQQIVGQDVTHGLSLLWNYNATAGNATAQFGTLGNNNQLTIGAKNINFDTQSLAFTLQLLSTGRVRFGGGTDDGLGALQVQGVLTTYNSGGTANQRTLAIVGAAESFIFRRYNDAMTVSTDSFRIDGNGNLLLYAGRTLRLGSSYTNTPVTPSGYLQMQDSNGNTYNIPAVWAGF